jgi:hypothetical protein
MIRGMLGATLLLVLGPAPIPVQKPGGASPATEVAPRPELVQPTAEPTPEAAPEPAPTPEPVAEPAPEPAPVVVPSADAPVPGDPVATPIVTGPIADEDLPGYEASDDVAVEEEAKGPLRPGTRRWFVGAWVGINQALQSAADGGWMPNLQIEESIGLHFKRSSAGPAVAVVFQQALQGHADAFSFLPRLSWGIQPSKRHGIYLTPMVGFGYKLLRVADREIIDGQCTDMDGCIATYSHHQATLQAGFGITFVFADRVPLELRPIGIDASAPRLDGDRVFITRWQMGAGLGVTF